MLLNCHKLFFDKSEYNTMKFSSATLLASLFATTSAFAPAATRSGTDFSRSASLRDLVTASSVSNPSSFSAARKSTEINLFGRNKGKSINSKATVDGEITPKEVRALFELWNAALATGDSRIVASRYTKVSFILLGCWFSLHSTPAEL